MSRAWCERWDCDLENVAEWQMEQCKRDEWYCTECPHFGENETEIS